MLNRNYNKSDKSIRAKKAVYIVVFIVLVALMFLDINIRPVIKKVANYQGRVIATKFVDKAINNTLDSEQVDYEDIIVVSRNPENEIVGVETNMKTINKIKSEVSQRINENFDNLSSYNYKVPLGTLLNSDYLVGRGPTLDFKVSPAGYVKTNFVSKFSSVGVNQTVHQILINIEVEICTILPLHKNVTTLTTDYLVAETVIVGDVPNYYSNILADSQQLANDVNKYKFDDISE